MAPSRENQLDAWLALTRQTSATTTSVKLPMLSGSMAPMIPVNAILDIAIKPERACRAGDVVVFQAGDKLIAHRILLALQAGPWRYLLEKGDANPRGHWRRDTTVRGRVIGFSVSPAAPVQDPTDQALARRGLRHHLRHFLFTLGGLRSTNPSEKQHG